MSSATQLLEFRGPKIYAMCGKFVEVDDTDAEGRLVLAGECHFNCFLSGTLKLALRHVALCFDRAEVAYSTDVSTLTRCVALLNPLIFTLCASAL